MRLFGQTFTANTLARIREAVAGEDDLTRSALSRRVCDWLDWHGPQGKPQEVSARKALGELERRGLIELPLARVMPPQLRGDPAPLPWEGVTLFGTTDVDHPSFQGDEPAISDDEVDYLLTAVSHGFPELELSHGDVQATLSGIRAVVDTGKENPSKESREHVLWRDKGLLTVTGGKLTTFRVMAVDALKAIRSQLPSRPRFRGRL